MATKGKKTKIPPGTEAEVMFKSNLQCCVCQKRGDQIHHLSGSENNFDNLALLCFPHHDLATIEKSLRKKLSREAIIQFRKHHYEVIENRRKKSLGTLNTPISELTEESLLTIAKNAVIILEIENIKKAYWDADWKKRDEIIRQLDKFINHSNPRLNIEIFQFFSHIASMTRGNMPYDSGCSFYLTVLNFFPGLNTEEDRKQSIQIADQCIHIGHNIAYDAFIHLRNLAVATWGLLLIKLVYRSAKENKITELITEVNRTYNDIESTLRRTERNDLNNAQELTKIFRADLDEWDLGLPSLPKYLQKIIDAEK